MMCGQSQTGKQHVATEATFVDHSSNNVVVSFKFSLTVVVYYWTTQITLR